MGLTCEFQEHGGDIGTRTLQNVNQFSCFGNSWEWIRNNVLLLTALVEMSICHMFCEVQTMLVE